MQDKHIKDQIHVLRNTEAVGAAVSRSCYLSYISFPTICVRFNTRARIGRKAAEKQNGINLRLFCF